MASSKVRKKDSKKVEKKESEVIEKKILEDMIEKKRVELKKKEAFIHRLATTIKTEQTKISELEGAILTLHELLTGEKVE